MTTTVPQQRQFPCRQCGAQLQFAPGQDALSCPYCKAENHIPTSNQPVLEQDFLAALADQSDVDATEEVFTIRCDGCGAQSTLPPDTTAGLCPFCASPVVAAAQSHRHIKPRSLLPFKIAMDQALAAFRAWIASLWFAPSELKAAAKAGRINGIYIPYWTYDCRTESDYTGQRGEDYTETETYWDTETYTETENGESVTKTRQVQKTRTVTKTRWWPVSGHVTNRFDDLLILASNTLPSNYIQKLEPWDLDQLVAYADEYLAGFVAQSYQVDLTNGFEQAKQVMVDPIHSSIRSHIGGDHQQIDSVSSRYFDITFKHILLPLWLSAYRYREKLYRFLVNARTGQVAGERPYSFWKITIAVLIVVAIIVAAILIFARK